MATQTATLQATGIYTPSAVVCQGECYPHNPTASQTTRYKLLHLDYGSADDSFPHSSRLNEASLST